MRSSNGAVRGRMPSFAPKYRRLSGPAASIQALISAGVMSEAGSPAPSADRATGGMCESRHTPYSLSLPDAPENIRPDKTPASLAALICASTPAAERVSIALRPQLIVMPTLLPVAAIAAVFLFLCARLEGLRCVYRYKKPPLNYSRGGLIYYNACANLHYNVLRIRYS